MNLVLQQLSRLALTNHVILQNVPKLIVAASAANIHTNIANQAKWNTKNNKPQKFLRDNKVIYPPQEPHEEPRKAYVCHMRANIKYSPDKMWYVACMVRGMTADEAIKQLTFVRKKGAQHAKEVIQEAQELAVKHHNVEFKSNLWVAESFTGKGRVFKGLRRHARGRVGRVEYKHCHYFVRLEEGEPPKHYYLPAPQTPKEQFDAWLENMRKRKVFSSL